MGQNESKLSYRDPITGFETTYYGKGGDAVRDVAKAREDAGRMMRSVTSQAVSSSQPAASSQNMHEEFKELLQLFSMHLTPNNGIRYMPTSRGLGNSSFSNYPNDDIDNWFTGGGRKKTGVRHMGASRGLGYDGHIDSEDDDVKSFSGGSCRGNGHTVKSVVNLYSQALILHGPNASNMPEVCEEDLHAIISYHGIAEFALAANAKYRQAEIETYPLDTALRMSQAFMADDKVRKRIADMKASGELIDFAK